MSTIERLTVAMPAEMAALLHESVDSGEYASASEIVREAVHDWMRRRLDEQAAFAALREAIREGDEDPESIPAHEVFAEMRAMIAEHRKAA